MEKRIIFIFCSRFGGVPNPQTVNHTIKYISNQYNADEVGRARKGGVNISRLRAVTVFRFSIRVPKYLLIPAWHPDHCSRSVSADFQAIPGSGLRNR